MAAEIATAATSTANNTPLFNAAGATAGVNAAGTLLGTWAQYRANKALAKEQQEWNEEMMNKQNEWSLNMWNKTNEYNAPSAQVQRLRDAGLNPLYYGLDGSSANAFESAQPLGYQRAEAPNFGNIVGESIALGKEVELKNAQIDKLKADTAGVGLDNEWKEKTMGARVESENLKNKSTEADIENKRQELQNKQQELKKLIAETESEVERKGLIIAETAVQNALKSKTDEETASIIALRPYEIMLKEAQTQAQKAAAASSYANAMLTNGLIESGYIERTIADLSASTKVKLSQAEAADAKAALDKYVLSVKNGTLFDTSANGMPKGKAQMFVEDVLANFFVITSAASTALGGASGAVAGAVVGSAMGEGSNSPRTVVKGFGK